MTEKFYILCGVTSADKNILKRFFHPEGLAITFRVAGTSQDALPSDSEIHEISKACPYLVFPGGIKWGLGGPKKIVNIREEVKSKMASVLYVDEGSTLLWFANEIDMKGEKFAEIEVNGSEVVLVKYLLPEALEEIVGSDF